MRSPGSRIARAACASVCLALMAGGSLLTGCGSANRTIAIPTATSAVSRFAGVYTGPWTFTAGFDAGAPPTFGGTMSLTIDSKGNVAAVFTDTVGAGQGSFGGAGTVDASGTITYVSPSPNLVGARTFSGVVTTSNAGVLMASGTLFYDYPGTSYWSATGQPSRS